jgi:hypothetical protein
MASVALPSIVQSAEYTYQLTVTDGSGAAINLSTATITGQIRKAPGQDLYATFSPTLVSGFTNKIVMALNATQTGSIPATPDDTVWAHDVFAQFTDGRRIRILRADITVEARVTA